MTMTDRIAAMIIFGLWDFICYAFLSYPLIFLGWRWLEKRRGRNQPPFIYLAIWLVVLALAVQAITSFLNFNAQGNKVEAKSNLMSIFTMQKNYHDELGTFAGGPRAFDLLNWEAAGQNRYAYYCGEDVIVNLKDKEVKVRPGANWLYKRRPASSPSAFTCVAVGNIDNDDFLDVWSIDDSKQLHSVMNDVGNLKEGQWDPKNTRNIFVAIAIAILFGSLFTITIRNGRKRKIADGGQ